MRDGCKSYFTLKFEIDFERSFFMCPFSLFFYFARGESSTFLPLCFSSPTVSGHPVKALALFSRFGELHVILTPQIEASKTLTRTAALKVSLAPHLAVAQQASVGFRAGRLPVMP
jgi:hypothetical protein